MRTLKSSQLVTEYGCGAFAAQNGEGEYAGVATLSSATAREISFLTNSKYETEAAASAAGAIVCAPDAAGRLAGTFKGQIFTSREPYAVFARLSQYFFQVDHRFSGRSESAFVDVTAKVSPTATLFPFVYVGPGAEIGAGAVLYPGAFVGAGSTVGADAILYPNSVVREGCRVGDRCILNPGAVVGGDGFGFAPSGRENIKIPQIGGVVLGEDVEIGSNSSIDRAAFDNTVIGAQTKIDSLVQIGHNVRVGESCFLAGQTGVAGSTTVGNRVTLAGQVGVAGHISIADGVTVLAQSGVSKDLPKAGVYGGTPVRPHMDWLREVATISRLTRERGKK
jgi:UDP-3-O-[3-hydroxymyristoyl] glucosamine N-acyltransferase